MNPQLTPNENSNRRDRACEPLLSLTRHFETFGISHSDRFRELVNSLLTELQNTAGGVVGLKDFAQEQIGQLLLSGLSKPQWEFVKSRFTTGFDSLSAQNHFLDSFALFLRNDKSEIHWQCCASLVDPPDSNPIAAEGVILAFLEIERKLSSAAITNFDSLLSTVHQQGGDTRALLNLYCSAAAEKAPDKISSALSALLLPEHFAEGKSQTFESLFRSQIFERLFWSLAKSEHDSTTLKDSAWLAKRLLRHRDATLDLICGTVINSHYLETVVDKRADTSRAKIPLIRSLKEANAVLDRIEEQGEVILPFLLKQHIARVGSIATDILVGSADSKTAAEAQTFLAEFASLDVPPEVFGRPKTVRDAAISRMNEEMLETLRRGLDLRDGFRALEIEARRLPDGGVSMLERFGGEMARTLQTISMPGRDSYPGKGIVMSGLDPLKLFDPDPNNRGDPMHEYKEAWPWLAGQFEDLIGTRYIFTRGLQIAMGRDADKFALGGAHYSSLVYNEHFGNPERIGHILVPTRILVEQLQNVFEQESVSPQNLPLKLEELKEFLRPGETLIELTSPSVVGGMLCNAFLPNRPPFHEWEKECSTNLRDRAGHVHKAMRLDSISHRLNISQEQRSGVLYAVFSLEGPPVDETKMASLEHAHLEAYRLGATYHNLWDLFRLGLANFHKGHNAVRSVESEGKSQLHDSGSIRDLQAQHQAFRMLIEAYRWHKQPSNRPEDFPVLVRANTLQSAGVPYLSFQLDTQTMVLTDTGRGKIRIQLPKTGNGYGNEERALWSEHVIPMLSGENHSGIDLRFYNRQAWA